jgi:hypothetical protein
MAPKYHPMPLSGGDRKALAKELVKSRAMTGILAEQSEQFRSKGEALIRKADNLACQSWNERMWSDGGPAQPSPTIGQAINGGFPWLEVECSRCKTMRLTGLKLKTPRQVSASFSAISMTVRRISGVLILNMASTIATPSLVDKNFENSAAALVLPPRSPSKKSVTSHPSTSAILSSRPALTRFMPFSYF